MHTDKPIEPLQKIEHVDAPPFLFTRIMEQIHSLHAAPAPLKWKWAFAVTAIFIIVLNISVMIKSTAQKERNGLSELIGNMHLSSSNNLYDE